MRAIVLGDASGNVSKGAVRPFRPIDLAALLLITDRSNIGPMHKRLAKKKLEKQYRKGMAYPENEPEEWQWRMTEARMMLGDFSNWQGWEWRNVWSKGLWLNPKGSWQGRPEAEIWVYGEQGIGDEILFSQVLPDAQKQCQGKLIFECEPRMVSVFARSFEGMNIHPVPVRLKVSENGLNVRHLKSDHGLPWMPVGDLLRNFRKHHVQFKREPWITPDPEKVEKYGGYKGRVGIMWRGAQGVYDWKSFRDLYPDAVSLQYDQKDDELVERCPFDQKEDVEDLLGLIANLERVVGPSNTAIHMAASMGVKTDVVLAPMNSGRRKNALPFRYFGIPGSRKSIWYPHSLTRYESLEDYKRNKDRGDDSPFGLGCSF